MKREQGIPQAPRPPIVSSLEALDFRIDDVLATAPIKPEDADTIRDVLQRRALKEMLLANPEGRPAIEAASTGDLEAIEKLRLLCQGVWLESTNTFAISEEGELVIDVANGELQLAPEVTANEHEALYRQAILRQIERDMVMDFNGLKGPISDLPKNVLDVGSGTLIGSSMMRRRFPQGDITAVEPGFISEKTRAIAEKKDIELVHGGLDEVSEARKFDTIILHFVLEHSVDQARDLVRQALRRLAEGGEISIAVPNFDAFHRELETTLKMNQRDPNSRLSLHDNLSGHQVIFTKEKLLALIHEVMQEEGVELPVEANTILPRPFAFNELAAANRHRQLLDLEKGGHIPGMEEKGSVLCITIGQKDGSSQHMERDSGEETRRLFTEIIEQYLEKRPKARNDVTEFLKTNYPELLAR